MVVAAKEFKVPYGVCELNKKGDLKKSQKNLNSIFLQIQDCI